MTRRWVLCVLASVAATAAAGPRRTTEPVTLRKKPGEKEAVAAKLAANTEVIVISEDGRWLKVRANGAEGYLTRTQISDDGPPAAPAGAWSAHPPEVLGKRAEVVAGPAAVAAYTRAAPARLALHGELGIGYRSLGMDLTSNAEGGLTNYLVDADAMAAVLDGGGTLRLGGALFVGFDARSSVSSSSPGIDYPGPTAAPGKIPFTTFALDAGGRAGVRVHDIDPAVRAGGHYDAFLPKSVDNAAHASAREPRRARRRCTRRLRAGPLALRCGGPLRPARARLARADTRPRGRQGVDRARAVGRRQRALLDGAPRAVRGVRLRSRDHVVDRSLGARAHGDERAPHRHHAAVADRDWRGLLTRAVFIILCLLCAVARSDDFLKSSPGELSKSHGKLDSQDQCSTCHEPDNSISANKCLGCHEHDDCKQRIARGARVPRVAEGEGRPCKLCHQEHRGRGFDPMGWAGIGGGRASTTS